MRRFWIPLVLVFLLLLGFAASRPGRRLGEAVGLLADVWMVGGESTVRPGTVETITYPGPHGETRSADLYCDADAPPGARLLLVHGLVTTGKDDSRLRALGTALSRHSFGVLIPDFPGMRSLRAGREDIAEVAAAIEALHGLNDCSGEGAWRPLQTGIVGFSYSAGPVLLALDQPARRADFAVLFGGYHDLAEVILFLTTGTHGYEGSREEGETLPEGRWLLLEANAAAVAGPADRDALVAIARKRREGRDADITELETGLGPEARALLALMSNTDPARFEPLLQQTGEGLRTLIADLSPSRSLPRPIEADLMLLHARSDIIIPYTQSLKLARGVRLRGTVRVALLGGFRHARPKGSGGAARWWATALRYPADSLRLLLTLNEILARRDRKSLTEPRSDRP